MGPNWNRGERDRELLVSCYRHILETADELGASTLAIPLISAGSYGWPVDDAVRAAVETLATTPSRVEDVAIVAFTESLHHKVERQLTRSRD